jgi:hypothetical protein
MSDKFFSQLLNQSCNIYRVAQSTPDALGVSDSSHLPVSLNTKCRIHPATGFLLQDNKGTRENDKYYGYFLPDANILENDIVIFNNKVLYVRDVQNESGENHHLKVIMETQGK